MNFITRDVESANRNLLGKAGTVIELALRVIESPEDYVFILSPSDWGHLVTLYSRLAKASPLPCARKRMVQMLSEFAKSNHGNLIALVTILRVDPRMRKYEMSSLTQPAFPGCCHLVYFAKAKQADTRAEKVLLELYRMLGVEATPSLS